MTQDFKKKIKDLLSSRIEEQDTLPRNDAGGLDDFRQWISEHSDQATGVICDTPEFKDMPFCGSGNY